MKGLTKKLGRAVLISVIIFSFAYLSIGVMSDVWWTEPVDMVINMTADFDAVKVNTTTITDRYNQSANTLEIDFPYASKDANLTSYWRFEDLTDETGNNDGIIAGTVTLTPLGKFNNAYDFSGGAGSYIDVGNDASLNPRTEISFGGWFKTTDTQAVIMGKYSSGTARQYATLLHSTYTGHISTILMNETGNFVQPMGSAGINAYDGNWHFVMTTYDGANVILYYDGVEQNRFGLTGDLESASANNLWIGDINLAGWEMDGIIDEVKLYDRALSSTEITELYNNGKQYIDSNWGGSVSNWTSDAQTMTASSYLKNLTVNFTGFDQDHYIDKIEVYKITPDTYLGVSNSINNSGFYYSNNSVSVNMQGEMFWVDMTADAADAAILGYSLPSNANTTIWNYTVMANFTNFVASSGAQFIYLLENTTAPQVATNTVLNPLMSLIIIQRDTGVIDFAYKNTAGTNQYWNSGTSTWTTTAGLGYAGAVGTTYIATVESNGTHVRQILESSTKANLMTGGWIDWNAMNVTGFANRWLLTGEFYTSHYYADFGINYVNFTNITPAVFTGGLTFNSTLIDDANLVSLYQFENNANDEVGVNDGTVTGATVTSSGKYGNAYSFDGGDFINASNGTSLNITSAITVSAWIYRNTLTANEAIITKWFYQTQGYGRSSQELHLMN
ncbi:MAG: LamG domain-containing protein [Nanoarchaeota archaeon]|nr:LamG domain-containing protein [Nanoarchaeota archaeon]MBU4124480.1 LamG domain-containing protein [Nanoarchaeota archaeon]